MTPKSFCDLTGHVFNRLTVVERIGTKSHSPLWKCLCQCGESHNATSSNLKSGSVQSCGCFHSQRTVESNTKHGMSYTREGMAWAQMLDRCYNPKNTKTELYLGRGIKVCEFLRSTPVNLLVLIGKRPEGKMSLDRINTNGNYSCGACAECLENTWPLNVRWATIFEQNRNRRCTRWVTINGETKCVDEWVSITGIPRTTFRRRYLGVKH